jgi:EAL domain-containing protein (putative c-di-GMP-specific phosphodiesterase class I)/GGDEF domain-containing protein
MDFSAEETAEVALGSLIDRKERAQKFSGILEHGLITSHFQPIVDLFTAEIFGYELLARGEGEFTAPAVMFEAAKDLELTWELENACRVAALERILEVIEELPGKNFFINVSPEVFSSSKFQQAFTMGTLKSYGIDSRRVILEITETASVADYARFEDTIRYYVKQGFRIALDDFGSGHSGLITLVATTPHFMKVDKQLVSGLHRSSYKQSLVKAICQFADTVGSAVLAEGIETMDELHTAFRLGARYAQGYLFARPGPHPAPLSRAAADLLEKLSKEYGRHSSFIDIAISKLITRPPTFFEREITGNNLNEFFKTQSTISHVLIVDADDRPKGLITRQHFYSLLSGQYGYAIFQRKPADQMAKRDMLTVRDDTDLRMLGKLAMSRNESEVHDPVVVIGKDGHLVGTISMKDLINKAFDTEIRYATSTNPLTGLPGNIVINVWLEELLLKPAYTIAYFDLDRFKEFNDHYGFSVGDELIKMVAEVLSDHIQNSESTCRLGHVGGDDFMMFIEELIEEEFFEAICRDFDERKRSLFSDEDLKKGCFMSENRQGKRVRVVLTTLSVAIVTSLNFERPPHPGKLGQNVAHLKSKAKERNYKAKTSGFLFDRRHSPS